ncbi:hypothetical protein AB0L70_21820 [Kribbella sp. NPDC051952]|uniref:hypothetical protein n=1 Tax=Kribbella sp. NPDC051952 TaxID=3154851 RepID=UPI003442FC1F
MAGSQAVALMLIIIVAYYIASYWRKLVFLLAVVVISVFGFGVFMLAQVFHGEPSTPDDQIVKTETTTHQN